jgi:hypothetical protein
MVTLTIGIMFLLFSCMYFGCSEFYDGGPRVCRPPINLPAIVESLRNTVGETLCASEFLSYAPEIRGNYCATG